MSFKTIFAAFFVLIAVLISAAKTQNETDVSGNYPKLFLTDDARRALIVWENKYGAFHEHQARFINSSAETIDDPFPVHKSDELVFNKQGEFIAAKFIDTSTEYNPSYIIRGWVYNSQLDTTPPFLVDRGS